MTIPNNPLHKYFRQPAIYITLPSRGKFYPEGSLDMPVNNELPVFPMTAYDEIAARTPDALFNGSALVTIVNSCVPNIKDPWNMPTIDMNSILAAIRLASYGYQMEIPTRCPKCGSEFTVSIDLRQILDGIQTPDYDTPLDIGDLSIYLAPMSYRQLNEIGKIQFENQKVIALLSEAEIPETDKLDQIGEAYRRVTQLTIHSIASSIAAVKTPDSMVTDPAIIEDFLMNADKALYEQVRQRVIDLRTQTDIKPLQMTCDSCAHEYTQELTLDMSNFFETAS